MVLSKFFTWEVEFNWDRKSEAISFKIGSLTLGTGVESNSVVLSNNK